MDSFRNIVIEDLRIFEGEVLTPYICPASKPTIGLGYVIQDDDIFGGHKGSFIKNKCLTIFKQKSYDRKKANAAIAEYFGNLMTSDEAEKLADDTLVKIWRRCRPSFGNADMTDRQCAALLSFIYNIGVTAYLESTAAKYVGSNNLRAVPKEMRKWVWATVTEKGKEKKVKLPGLIKRREHEAKMFEESFS